MKRGSLLPIATAWLVAASAAIAEPVVLAPLWAGSYVAGTGVDAVFRKVHDSWQGSTVLWNQQTGQYGSGSAIGGFSWGTGIWGVADWQAANSTNPPPEMVSAVLNTRVSQISFGDERYNQEHGARWGTVDVAPLFGSSAGSQDNWTSRFTGYLRITQPGLYNFSVLSDDGFFFRLSGAGQQLGIHSDYVNPRERVGFEQDLMLQEGLYEFELGAYDRLEAGVVDLSWSRDGGPVQLVPTANLVGLNDVQAVVVPVPVPVSEPASAWLVVAAGLGLFGSLRRRQQGAQAVPA